MRQICRLVFYTAIRQVRPFPVSSSTYSAPRQNRRLWLGLLILTALATFAALSWQRLEAFNWSSFLAAYASIHWGWMGLSIFLVLGTYAARVFRWHVMISPLNPEASRWRIFRATTIGFTSVVLLGRPGEFVRPWLIAKSENVPVSSQMAAWFLERIFDLLAVLALFGFGLFYFDPSGRDIGAALAWILNAGGALVAIIASACLVILFFAARAENVFTDRLRDALTFLPDHWKERVYELLGGFSGGMACCRSGRNLTAVFLYTGVEWLIITAGTMTFFRSFPDTSALTTLDSVVYLGFIAFGSIVQIPGLGGGVQVAGMVVLSQLFGLPAERAAGIAVANWLVNWVSILPIGLAMMAGQGLRWTSLRQISKDLSGGSSS